MPVRVVPYLITALLGTASALRDFCIPRIVIDAIPDVFWDITTVNLYVFTFYGVLSEWLYWRQARQNLPLSTSPYVGMTRWWRAFFWVMTGMLLRLAALPIRLPVVRNSASAIQAARRITSIIVVPSLILLAVAMPAIVQRMARKVRRTVVVDVWVLRDADQDLCLIELQCQRATTNQHRCSSTLAHCDTDSTTYSDDLVHEHVTLGLDKDPVYLKGLHVADGSLQIDRVEQRVAYAVGGRHFDGKLHDVMCSENCEPGN